MCKKNPKLHKLNNLLPEFHICLRSNVSIRFTWYVDNDILPYTLQPIYRCGSYSSKTFASFIAIPALPELLKTILVHINVF